MRRVGDQDRSARVAELRVVGTHDEQPRELTGGARGRLQGRARHPRDLTEGALQPPEHLQRALRRPIRLQRVQPREAGRRGGHLGKLGVVLHRAGAEGIDPGVDAVVHLRQARVVPDQIPLRDLRKSAEARRRRCFSGISDGSTSSSGKLHAARPGRARSRTVPSPGGPWRRTGAPTLTRRGPPPSLRRARRSLPSSGAR